MTNRRLLTRSYRCSSFPGEYPALDRLLVPTVSQPAIKTTTRNPAQNGNNSRPRNQRGAQPSKHNVTSKNKRKDINHSDTRTPLPVLLPVPNNCFSREKIVNKILDRTDEAASVALFGPIGVGKSSVALNLLHHNRTKARFGKNRHFMRCDDLKNSLADFQERLSDTFCTDTNQLHAHLRSSPPFILLLDGVDLILDSLSPEARGISATIQTIGSYEHVCLVTTSRMNPEIHGFHPVTIPTLSEDGARETFYSLCNLPKSSAVDSLIGRLDFHPLSIELLAGFVRQNDLDEPTLLKACGNDKTNRARTNYYKRLREAVEPALQSPTIKRLGSRARDVLKEIAASTSGIKEYELERNKAGTGEVVDVLCKFSLVYRQDGFVKMLFPFRSYFVELTLVPQKTEEIIYRGPTTKPCVSFSLSHGVTPFDGFLVDVTRHSGGGPPRPTPRPVPRNADHIRGRARMSFSFYLFRGDGVMIVH